MALRIDVQSLMVELDRHGIYAGEIFDGEPDADAGSRLGKTGGTAHRNPGSSPGDRR